MPLRSLKIGTYVAASPNSPIHPFPDDEQEKRNNMPFYPIATATLNTRVYNVVHMFSERGISAVPIVDDNGVVVNLYETVDVIVSAIRVLMQLKSNGSLADTCQARSLPIA